MSDVKRIATAAELRDWLRQQERQRLERFVFLPVGQLAARCPGGSVNGLMLEIMSLVKRVETTVSTVEGRVTQVECRVTYHDCVRMLDAWNRRSIIHLAAQEQQALRIAEDVVRRINGRCRLPMEKLYMLYSYIGASIDYRRGSEDTDEFSRLTSAACALVSRVANCQGFAGVMYLTGGMMGFRVGLQGGRSAAGGHMWNTVEMGLQAYAMDCSASAVARSQSRRMLADYATFLMGRRETQENGLIWTPEQESLRLSPALAAEHDFYRSGGVSASSAREAAAAIWKRRFAGDKLTHVRIRAASTVTLGDVNAALRQLGDEPAVNRAIAQQLGGAVRYSLLGSVGERATYLSVEWN